MLRGIVQISKEVGVTDVVLDGMENPDVLNIVSPEEVVLVSRF